MTTDVHFVSSGAKWCLTESNGLSTLAFMKPDPKAELTALNLRDSRKARLQSQGRRSLKEHVTKILDHPVTELEKKEQLPKPGHQK